MTELALAARHQTAGRFDATVHDAVVAAGYDRTFESIAPDGPEAENGAGRADDAVEPDRRDLLDVRADLADHLLDEFSLVAARDRIASDELLGQPDDTNLEASRQLHLGAGAKRDFGIVVGAHRRRA